MRVYAENTTFDSSGDAQCAAEIVGPKRAAKAVRRGVNIANHLVFVVERCDANDGPEDLFEPTTVTFADVEQNCRFEEITFARRTVTPSGEFASLLASIGEKFFYRVALAVRDKRAELRLGFGRIADNQSLRRSDKSLYEWFVNAAFDEEPAAGATVLAGIGEDA